MTKTPAGGGLEIIREACASRASVHATMARDCGVSNDLLDSFVHGRAELPAENLDRVVDFIWNGHIEYNAEADALQSVPVQPEPRSLGVRPTWNIDIPKHVAGALQRSGPQPVVAAPKKQKRAGWIGVWE